MVYLANSLSSATLELLVHTDDFATIKKLYSYIPVDIPDECIEAYDITKLPSGWDSPIPIAATQALGDAWVLSMSSAVLKVPSAITSGEANYLGNPVHPDFSRLVVKDAREFGLDPRI